MHMANALTVEILNHLEQGSHEWLELRKKLVTGTDLASVIREESWPVLRKQKSSNNNFKSAAMERGNRLEPEARAVLQEKTGLIYLPTVMVCKEEGILVSLDGLAFGRVATCEIKCPEKGQDSKLWKAAEENKIPHRYLVQMQGGLLLSGAKVCHYWVYDEVSRTGIKIDVYPDPVMQGRILESVRDYWNDGGHDQQNERFVADLKADKDFTALQHEYLALVAQQEMLKKEMEAVEAMLKGRKVPGLKVTRGELLEVQEKENQGSVDWKAAALEHAPHLDPEQYRKAPKSATSLKIRLNSKAKEQINKIKEKKNDSTAGRTTATGDQAYQIVA